ncbi:MAG TPA: hypothetical protein VGP62_25465 [Bryobacteraceae bacterium]|nr:hypothetical protein [Bryobacteraceae bacterium]
MRQSREAWLVFYQWSTPATTHEVTVRKITAWLNAGARGDTDTTGQVVAAKK